MNRRPLFFFLHGLDSVEQCSAGLGEGIGLACDRVLPGFGVLHFGVED